MTSCCGYPVEMQANGTCKCVVSGTVLSVMLTTEEAAQLHRFLFRSYLNPNEYPALVQLMTRLQVAG